MNRNEFMRRLESQLKQLSKEEAVAALEYYNEYFDDAGIENEQRIIEELGSVERIATQLKAQVAMKKLEGEETPSVKKGISAIWLVVLAIFAAPLALPLAFAAFILLASVFIVVFALIISLGAIAISCFIASVATIIGGVITVGESLMGSVFNIGLGMVIFGISILLGIAVTFVTRRLCHWLAKLMNKFLARVNKGGKDNE